MRKWRIAGVNFDHFHMGDNLRFAWEHPACEIVGICDEQPQRMRDAVCHFGIPEQRVFTDYRQCLETTRPDLVILCPAAADHGRWTTQVAPYGVHLIIEKPFAATLAEADAMIAALAGTGRQMLINWPLAWYPPHRTTKRLIDEGAIGQVIEVHFYDGNRGPLWHTADKVAVTAEQVATEKPHSWFYQKSHGGGSLLDYLGYGTTLGTWFMNGAKPLEVTAVTDEPVGLEVDEHSIVVARYAHGLSKFETRWGTFTDPWTHQPQPRCGFVIVGTAGTIASYDYDATVRVQDPRTPAGHEVPVDVLPPVHRNPVAYLVDCLERECSVEGPVSAALSRIGQQIVDTAVRSAAEKRTLPLIE
jgi:glucose-fructose oxidoreductase